MEPAFRGETGAENRRFPRKRLRLALQYKRLERDHLPSAVESRLEDLGAGGRAMVCEHHLERNQLLMVTLYLPPGKQIMETSEPVLSDRDCTPVNILARVAWCTEGVERGFVCGVQFLDCDPVARKRLKDFLVDFDLDNPDSSLYQ